MVGILEEIGANKVIKSTTNVLQTRFVSQTVIDIEKDNGTMIFFDVSLGRLNNADHNITLSTEPRDMEDICQNAISVYLPASTIEAAECTEGENHTGWGKYYWND